jgi:hypothetical protein
MRARGGKRLSTQDESTSGKSAAQQLRESLLKSSSSQGQQGGRVTTQASSADEQVAAILGSAKPNAPLASRALRVLREIADDKSAPASARVTAANALRVEESAASAVAADIERDRVTAALRTVPMHERLLLLERIVRRHEPAGWLSVFAQVRDGADPAESAGVQAEE